MRIYLVPVVGTGQPVMSDPRRPKYFMSAADGTGLVGIVSGSFTVALFGFEPWAMVGAELSGADDATIVGEPDAFAIPTTLDATLTSGQVTSVQNKLEAINVPALWVTTAFTWRQVVRATLGIFTLAQRFFNIHGAVRLFSGGITLASQVSDLPVGARNDLLAAATSLGLDTSGITGATTLRNGLKILGDQLSGMPFTIGQVSI